MPAGAEHREPIVLAPEETIRGGAHHHQVLGVRTHAAQDAVDALDEQRPLDQAFVKEVGKVVEMTDVVALELEARAASFAQRSEDVRDVLKRVAKYEVFHPLDVGLLPVVAPVLDLARRLVDREVHRPHVQRAHLRLGLQRIGQALLHRHPGASAGRDVDHRIGRRGDARHELVEDRRVGRRLPVRGVACMHVQDCCAGLGGFDRLLGDLVGCQRQERRHGRRVDGARHGAGNDDFVVCLGHGCLLV